ncbi:MAG: MoaD/ThiS family protein [Infirmifilum sp.]
MGKIRIFYYGFLSELAGKDIEEIEISSGSPKKVKDIVDPRVAQIIDRIIILVNNVSVKPDYVVSENDEVKLLPHIGGG